MLFKEQIASYEKTEDTEVAKLKGKKKRMTIMMLLQACRY